MAGTPCKTCTHPSRGDIDRRLLGGETVSVIAREYGLGLMAVTRHRDNHLTPEARAAVERARLEGDARGLNLLEELRALHRKASDLLEKAEASGDYRSAIAGIGQAVRVIEVIGRMIGDISDAPTVNIVMAPQFVQVRQVLIGALDPYPEARAAVLKALEGVQ
jgi:hypothetical protein